MEIYSIFRACTTVHNHCHYPFGARDSGNICPHLQGHPPSEVSSVLERFCICSIFLRKPVSKEVVI